MVTARSTFPLRLRDGRLRQLVREVAARDQLSQNELIEQAVAHEVVFRGAVLAEDLRTAADHLAALTAEQHMQLIDASIERFGMGESRPEPLRAEAWHPTAQERPVAVAVARQANRLGVMAAFDAGRAPHSRPFTTSAVDAGRAEDAGRAPGSRPSAATAATAADDDGR